MGKIINLVDYRNKENQIADNKGIFTEENSCKHPDVFDEIIKAVLDERKNINKDTISKFRTDIYGDLDQLGLDAKIIKELLSHYKTTR